MKITCAISLFACTWYAALGQGHVQFRNYYPATTPPIDARVYLYSGQPLNGSNPLWRAALIGGPTTATPASSQGPGTLETLHNPANTTLTWVNFRSGTTPPIADGYVIITSVARVVPGVNWGETALVQMVAWQGNFSTWAEAYAAWQAGTPDVLIGFSNPLLLPLPQGATSPNLTYLWGLNSFSIGPPSPSQPYFDGFTGPPANEVARAGDPIELTVSVNANPPPSFQWYFNGAPIAGATSSFYRITNPQPADAGEYYAVITHVLGTYTTPVSTLTVAFPPTIDSPPLSQTAVLGSGTLFRTSASGDAPLSYQWYFNSSVLLGTGTSLKLSGLHLQHVGAYTVVVSNTWAAVTSAPAMLNIIPPVEMVLAPGISGVGESATILNLEYADNLLSVSNWEPLTEISVGATNISQLYIDWPPPAASRYYRAWQTDSVSQPSLLSIQPVPALTLTGSIGSSIRVDYINRVGPIDAWVTLATMNLTNTSQVYFDTSAASQPARLYRLVPVP